MNKTTDLRDQRVMDLQVETIEKIASFPKKFIIKQMKGPFYIKRKKHANLIIGPYKRIYFHSPQQEPITSPANTLTFGRTWKTGYNRNLVKTASKN